MVPYLTGSFFPFSLSLFLVFHWRNFFRHSTLVWHLVIAFWFPLVWKSDDRYLSFFPSLLLKFVDSIREKTRKIKTNKMLALLDPEIRPCACSYQFWHAGTIFVCRNSFRKTRWGGKYLGTEPRHRGNSSQGMPFTASVVIALAGSLRVQVRKGQTLLGPRSPRPFSLSPPFSLLSRTNSFARA